MADCGEDPAQHYRLVPVDGEMSVMTENSGRYSSAGCAIFMRENRRSALSHASRLRGVTR